MDSRPHDANCAACVAATVDEVADVSACEEHWQEARLEYLYDTDPSRARAEDPDFADYAFETGGDR